MRKALDYIRDRLSEPGTMRSAVVVIVGIQIGATADAMIEALTGVALVVLGAISAAMPERKP